MFHSRKQLAWFLIAVLTTTSGASCPQFLSNYYPSNAGPRVLSPGATLADVIRVVNDNSGRVRSFMAPDAAISMPMTPPLCANLALERPRRFRLRAETSITGQEIDLGSNDSLFWFWVRRMQPPAVFFCRHEQFHTSAARQVVPVEPDWLIEALGIVTLDPAGQHTGPYPQRGDRLEVRTQLNTPDGPMSKITIVDAARGFVLEQHLYDGRGQLLASALTSQHFHDPASGVNLPRLVEIQWPATRFSLKINLHTVQVNQLAGDTSRLFEMPTYPGWNPIDLGDPNFRPPQAAQAAALPVAAPPQVRRQGGSLAY